jgi:hypothetical protein
MIDGEAALGVSEKLATVPERYRQQYACLLPLVQVKGCFECSVKLVWRTSLSTISAIAREHGINRKPRASIDLSKLEVANG